MVSISSHVGNRAASCCIIFHPKAWLKHLFGHLGMISFIHHDSRARENSEVVINLPTYTHLYIYIYYSGLCTYVYMQYHAMICCFLGETNRLTKTPFIADSKW